MTNIVLSIPDYNIPPIINDPRLKDYLGNVQSIGFNPAPISSKKTISRTLGAGNIIYYIDPDLIKPYPEFIFGKQTITYDNNLTSPLKNITSIIPKTIEIQNSLPWLKTSNYWRNDLMSFQKIKDNRNRFLLTNGNFKNF
jgi:hypothetical protein